MADTSTTGTTPITPVVVTPGNQTSEYKVTIISTVLSIAAVITGVVLDLLQSAQDAGVNGRWMAIGLSVFGVIGAVLTAVGYQVTRAHVKAAAAKSGQTTVTVLPAEQAAAKVFGS
jgi:ABC-type sugar transport system substrate-binding protein